MSRTPLWPCEHGCRVIHRVVVRDVDGTVSEDFRCVECGSEFWQVERAMLEIAKEQVRLRGEH